MALLRLADRGLGGHALALALVLVGHVARDDQPGLAAVEGHAPRFGVDMDRYAVAADPAQRDARQALASLHEGAMLGETRAVIRMHEGIDRTAADELLWLRIAEDAEQ